jgi:hypothetical protein
VSPESLANQSEGSIGRLFATSALQDHDCGELPFSGLDAAEGGDAAIIDIETTFRRMLIGLRRLPRRERAQALRAAREWRSFAMNALREKRLRDRHARYVQRRQNRLPGPR